MIKGKGRSRSVASGEFSEWDEKRAARESAA